MTYTYTLGIDVSKLTLDYALFNALGQLVVKHRVGNDEFCAKSIWQTLLTKAPDATLANTLVCAEYTGMYCYHLTQWACQGAALWLVSGKEIKHSGGITRGKDDALDAQRIALYAFRHRDKIRLWQIDQVGTIEQLKHLDSLRERLVNAKNTLLTPLKEQKNFMSAEHHQQLEALTQPSIEMLNKQIQEVEKAIDDIFDKDEHLKSLLKIMDSVPGVGKKVATAIIIKTNALKRFPTPQKLATHAGIAPFKYESGTSVKGKTGVSLHADKELKKLLHLAAMAATKTEGHFKQYYQRRKAEGYAPMSVLNAIRNKIIRVIYALEKKQQLFDKNFDFSLA
jgi:transposase